MARSGYKIRWTNKRSFLGMLNKYKQNTIQAPQNVAKDLAEHTAKKASRELQSARKYSKGHFSATHGPGYPDEPPIEDSWVIETGRNEAILVNTSPHAEIVEYGIPNVVHPKTGRTMTFRPSPGSSYISVPVVRPSPNPNLAGYFKRGKKEASEDMDEITEKYLWK